MVPLSLMLVESGRSPPPSRSRHMCRAPLLPRVGTFRGGLALREPIGRPWLSFYASAFLACLVSSAFLPGWVRVGILAALFGFCAPFFTEGVRRKVRARREPDDEETLARLAHQRDRLRARRGHHGAGLLRLLFGCALDVDAVDGPPGVLPDRCPHRECGDMSSVVFRAGLALRRRGLPAHRSQARG